MKPKFHILIPTRLDSKRLPNKPLLDICGKTMIERVYDCAVNSCAISTTIVTGDDLIIEEVQSFGGQVYKSKYDHESGTDRVAEAVQSMGFNDGEIILNLQGDEPGTPIKIIEQVAKVLSETAEATISTVCERITKIENYLDPNVVKVVRDTNNFALYFSRSPIPFNQITPKTTQNIELPANAVRHIGLYGYRVRSLKRLARKDSCSIENLEMLAAVSPGPGIDTLKDLENARMYFASL